MWTEVGGLRHLDTLGEPMPKVLGTLIAWNLRTPLVPSYFLNNPEQTKPSVKKKKKNSHSHRLSTCQYYAEVLFSPGEACGYILYRVLLITERSYVFSWVLAGYLVLTALNEDKALRRAEFLKKAKFIFKKDSLLIRQISHVLNEKKKTIRIVQCEIKLVGNFSPSHIL